MAAVVDQAGDVPSDRGSLAEWAEDAGISEVLRAPVGVLAGAVDPATAARLRAFGQALTVADAAVDERWTRARLGAQLGPRALILLRETARGYLEEAARERAAARAQEARRLARPPPEDPVLATVCERLKAARRPLRARVEPLRQEAVDAPVLRFDAKGHRFLFTAAGWPEVEVDLEGPPDSPARVRCFACEAPCEHALCAIDAVLDRLAAGAESIARALSRPAWARFLDAVEQRSIAPSAEALYWCVSFETSVPEPTPWEGAPASAGGRRLLGARLSHRLAAGLGAGERRALQLVAEAAPGDRETRALEVLACLAGHPRLVDPKGRPVEVARVGVGLRVTYGADGALAVAPTVGGRAVDLGELLSCTAGPWLLAEVDPKARRIEIAELGDEARTLLSLLHRYGTRFPAEAQDALLARLPTLQAALPLELPEALKGEEAEPDPRPVLRLDPDPERAHLDLEVVVEPVPGGPAFAPGAGPQQAFGRMGPERVFVVRRPSEERRRATHALLDLGLDPAGGPSPWRHTLEGDAALDGVCALQRLEEEGEIRVVWPADRRLSVRDAGLSSLELSVQQRRDWFQLRGGIRVEGELIELACLLDALEAGRRYVPVRGGLWCALEGALRERLLRAAELLDRDGRGPLRVPEGVAAPLGELLDGAAVEAPPAWDELREALRRARVSPPARPPPDLEATLRPYQLAGFRWMVQLGQWARGCVLADDMGLGKTLQAIALLLHRRRRGPALVVAPTSVGPNWKRELERFAPTLRARLLGADPPSERARRIAEAGENDVLLISYGLLTREIQALSARRFGTLVLDEAQALKNPRSERARAARALDVEFCLALTGTPLENNLGELWSLFSVVCPGLFGSARRFRERFVRPIEREGAKAPRRTLARLLKPFVLRRTKQAVVRELPPKVEMDVEVLLSPAERRLYEETRLLAVARLTGHADRAREIGRRRMDILAALTRLRLLACAPVLAVPGAPKESAKLTRFLEIASELEAEGHRALVFSQFTRFLSLAREAAAARGIASLMLDGSTPQAERGHLVERFQSGEGTLFFISLRAGGTGLNLTAADHVIHLDPWWNPALEDQATDRAHRIGQRRSVTVLRLVARGTIEEQIRALHEEKRALLSDVLAGAGEAASLSVEALEQLLTEGGEVFAPVEEAPGGEAAAPEEPWSL